MEIMAWLGAMILFLIIEVLTVGLATIWFAAGALAALIASALGMGILGQFLIFFIVSILLLVFTRPLAVRYINPHRVPTNYEDAIGKTVQITERVDNLHGCGTALLNGQEWTARSQKDDVVLEKDTLAKVLSVAGVKLIVVPAAPESEK